MKMRILGVVALYFLFAVMKGSYDLAQSEREFVNRF